MKKLKLIFALFSALLVMVYIGGCGNTQNDNTSNATTSTQEEQSNEDNKLKGIDLDPSTVMGDKTGRWRISVQSENIHLEDCAVEYYKKYFKSDDEVHFWVNFNYNTTTCITVMGNLLDVACHEYVKGEEHDAQKLGSGMLLAEYHVNKDTGEIKKVK